MATKKTSTRKPAARKTAARKTAAKKKSTGFDEYVESDELSVNDANSLAVSTPQSIQNAYTSTPNIDSSDVFIPKLRLAQGLTNEVQDGLARPGQWLMTGEDPFDEPIIVPLLMNRRRELRDDDDNRQVLCRSLDSLHGVGDPGGDCSTCPMAKWTQGRGKNSKNSPPACTFIYSYIVYSVEAESLAILEFYRTSIPAGKMMNTIIMQKGLGNFGIKLTASGSKGPKGTYYSPTVTPAKLSEAILKKARDLGQASIGG